MAHKQTISLCATWLTLLTLVSSGHIFAETGQAAADQETEVMTVVGTRTERQVNEVGASISVITAEELERQITRDIADLVRFEPGVSVSGTGSRFGLSGFNIRGIEGNRVLTIVDGVRVPDEFSFGPFLDSRRDFVDVDSIELVEIARGPISSLYGSDALGGIVSFTTKKPSYYVSDAEGFYADINAGYSSDDSSLNASTTLALGNEQIAGLISYTHRDAEETETQGSSGYTAAQRQEADPQDIEVDSILAKLEFTPWEGHNFLLSYEQFEHTNDAQILSDYGAFVRGTLINSRDARDERERQKWVIDYHYDREEGWLNHLALKVYQQTGTSEQLTNEMRTAASGPQTRFRYSEFEQEIEGALVQFGSSFNTGEVAHTLTYGVDYYATDNKSLRNGGTFSLDGTPLFEFSPLPTRDFPITEVEQIAYFIQDEIIFLDGKLRVTPGVRYDQFDADTQADAIYLAGNPGTELPQDYDDSEVTTSLSVVYQLNEAWSTFARYSEGFRAPPYDDVNVGFTNPLGGYKTIANPDLVSETSEGIELGLRWDGRYGDMLLTVFSNEYEDFIDPLSLAPQFLATGGIDPVDGFRTFQSVNRAEVEIDGVELSGLVELGELSEALAGFGLRYSLAYADGEDLERDEPLETINPLTAVLGLVYDAQSGRWGGQVVMTLVEGKDESDIASDSERPATSGYGIVDVLAYVDITDSITLNVGLFNVTDREYIRWADTLSIGGDAPERFTQPGFNAGATLKVVF